MNSVFVQGMFVGAALVAICLFFWWEFVGSDRKHKKEIFIKYLKLEVWYWGKKYNLMKKKEATKDEHLRKIYSQPAARLSSYLDKFGEFERELYGTKCLDKDFEEI